jgi:small subunit ribosomal protein S20
LKETAQVAHSLSAKKRVRQNLKGRIRNRARKEAIKMQVKGFQTALASGDFAKAETELRQVTRHLDKVAAKGTIHKNAASRKRSRLARRLNVARVAAPVVAKPSRGKSKAAAKG